jgi:CMP-N-acetylneuraminic acid synthetase
LLPYKYDIITPMNDPKITAVVPCRAGSRRVPNKNTRPFGGFAHGLLELKLRQLDAVPRLDEIFVTTNDPVVVEFIEDFRADIGKPIVLDRRPEEYAADDSLQGLIGYLAATVTADVVAWTHVTSPLFGPALYAAALAAFEREVGAGTADSLMAVDAVQTFALRAGEWISHDSARKRWPRTQDLDKIFLVNSALFVIARPLMARLQDRVGQRPFLFETPAPYGFDIDWEEDFAVGEKLYGALAVVGP